MEEETDSNGGVAVTVWKRKLTAYVFGLKNLTLVGLLDQNKFLALS